MSTMYKHWTELIKPKQLEVEEKTLTSTYGKFYAEPFERGFGQTIGNSLRRILLVIAHGRVDRRGAHQRRSCTSSPRCRG